VIVTRKAGLFCLLLSAGISLLWGCFLGWSLARGPLDFQAIYYGSKTLLLHRNPYNVPEVEKTYHAEDRVNQSVTARQYQNLTLYVNTTGTLLFVAPFAMFPLAQGQVLWMILNVTSFVVGAYLIWCVGQANDRVLTACLVCFMLLNCQVVFGGGNTAALAVGSCVIGAWCFLEERLAVAGVICMAFSLAIKPHDAGFVWLYFMLAGGSFRKRALQSAALSVAWLIIASVWVWNVAPTWLHDWQGNLAAISGRGGINDPCPAALSSNSANNVISLQAVFSVFKCDPHFYNLMTYAFCGVLLLIWVFVTLRSKRSAELSWVALAAVVPLTLLITYHRVHDTKLLLLTIPACAMFWASRRGIGWIALALTSATIFMTSDIPLSIIGPLVGRINFSASMLGGQLLTVLFARPGEELLVAMGIFYLWMYSRQSFGNLGGAMISEKGAL